MDETPIMITGFNFELMKDAVQINFLLVDLVLKEKHRSTFCIESPNENMINGLKQTVLLSKKKEYLIFSDLESIFEKE